jgi:tetratricopeptide (TPR) repeat protein
MRRRHRMWPLLVVLCGAVGLGACSSGPGPGGEPTREPAADADGATTARRQGVQLLDEGNPAEAIVHLEAALMLDADNQATIFYLARAYEATGRVEPAERMWTLLAAHRPKDVEVRTRLREARLARLRAAVAATLRDEAARNPLETPDNSIAVLEFALGGADTALAPLGKGVAAMIAGDLVQLGRFTVVEREKLAILLDEVELARKQGAVDPAAAPRAGRLLGARTLVQGNVGGGASGVALDAGLTESATGQAVGAGADAGGPLEALFAMEKEVVVELVEGLGVTLTPEERRSIGQPPTRHVEAFLAWSRGLGYEDAGDPVRARAAYQRAVDIDPGFRVARDHLASVSGSPAGLARAEATIFRPMVNRSSDGGDARRDRLDLMGGINGRGLIPGRPRDASFDPSVAPIGAVGGRGSVIIDGEVPR